MAEIIYFAVYPTGQGTPTAAQIVGQTVANGFFGTIPVGAGGTITDDAPITGLATGTTYDTAATTYDGSTYGPVVTGGAFTTDQVISVSTGTVSSNGVNATVQFNYDVAIGVMAVYSVVYPSSQSIPTSGAIISNTVPNGVQVVDAAPIVDEYGVISTQFTGLTLGGFYRISSVASDGLDTGQVWSSQPFQTYEINEITVGTGAATIAGVDAAVGATGVINATVGSVTIDGVDLEIDSSVERVIGTGEITVSGYNAYIAGSTWLDIPAVTTTWVDI